MTYREWERYERERLASRNGVANDLRTRVAELEAENERLRGLLSELVEAVKPSGGTVWYSCKGCGNSSRWDGDEIKHADDCAWWNAVQALGSE